MTSKALITGASAGLGAAYADRLAKRGHDLILVARGEDKLRELAARLPVDAEVLVADLTVPADVERVAARLATVDVFVNNAGHELRQPGRRRRPGRAAARDRPQRVRLHPPRAGVRRAPPGHADQHRLGRPDPAPRRAWPPTRRARPMRSRSRRCSPPSSPRRTCASRPSCPARSGPSCGTSPGFPLAHLDPEIVMPIDDAVDAALAGLDAGELITILSLPDAADWEAYEAARLALVPNMSRRQPAERYLVSDLPGTALCRSPGAGCARGRGRRTRGAARRRRARCPSAAMIIPWSSDR